ncbi:MAG: CpsD/CapB family tyrosine-protein kinase [Alphaproteobacteria bacterium]
MQKAEERGSRFGPGPSAGAAGGRRRPVDVAALADTGEVARITLADGKLRANKILAQMMDGRRGWSGQRRAVEAFRMVRTRARQTLSAGGSTVRVLAVTSPRQGDGKTLTSINLAMGMARQTTGKVLLIDGDLRLPGMAKTLGLKPAAGLSDYLAGTLPLAQCLLAAPGDKLFLLPQGRSLPHSSELLANGVLADLTRQVTRQFTEWTVIIDCPPILAVDDTLVILDAVDKALLVVREGRTRRTEMRRAAEAIGREKYLGTVLNDSRASRESGQYYYYDYGYE